MKEIKVSKSGKFIECFINDRGFVSRPPQVSIICPTLRAQDHGNPPKVIQIRESEGEKCSS